MEKISGKLYLLPADFGEGTETTHLILPMVTDICKGLKHFIVEEPRTARRYLRRIGFTADFDNLDMSVLNEHTPPEEVDRLLLPLKNGFNCGLISEAGMPCIADPGSLLVKKAHFANIEVIPVPGPASIFLTLAGSGLNGQNFCFSGYLPVDKKERQEKLRDLERESRLHNKSQIFIETPYRNIPLFEDILTSCSPSTLLCIGCELGSPSGWIKTKPISVWKKSRPEIHKKPCVFALQQE